MKIKLSYLPTYIHILNQLSTYVKQSNKKERKLLQKNLANFNIIIVVKYHPLLQPYYSPPDSLLLTPYSSPSYSLPYMRGPICGRYLFREICTFSANFFHVKNFVCHMAMLSYVSEIVKPGKHDLEPGNGTLMQIDLTISVYLRVHIKTIP